MAISFFYYYYVNKRSNIPWDQGSERKKLRDFENDKQHRDRRHCKEPEWSAHHSRRCLHSCTDTWQLHYKSVAIIHIISILRMIRLYNSWNKPDQKLGECNQRTESQLWHWPLQLQLRYQNLQYPARTEVYWTLWTCRASPAVQQCTGRPRQMPHPHQKWL